MINHSPKILILTSNTGGGHASLSESLRDRLEPTCIVSIEEKLLPRFFETHYSFLGRHALWLWSAEFRWTDTPKRAAQAHQMLILLITRRLNAVLDGFQPDAVITTHPLLSHAVACVLDKYAPEVPFAMLLSDPQRVHATWLSERRADVILAPTFETSEQCLFAGCCPSRVHMSGWPVRQQFYCQRLPTREEVFEQINRDSHQQFDPCRFTIFIQGGADGATKVAQTVNLARSISQKVQIILAAGHNQELKAHFNGVNGVYVLPFTKLIAPLMNASNAIQGKAGPNSLMEALTLGKPMIATSYISALEEPNLEFIQRHGLGWVALQPAQQSKLLSALVAEYSADNAQLTAMTKTVHAYHQQNAAACEKIVPLILSLVKEEKKESCITVG